MVAAVAGPRGGLQVVLERANSLGREWFAAKDPEQLERDRQRGRRDLLGHLLGDTPGFVFAEVLVVLEANADELLHRGANTAELVLLDRRELTFTTLAEARREVVEDGGKAVRGGRRHSEHVSHVSQAGVEIHSSQLTDNIHVFSL